MTLEERLARIEYILDKLLKSDRMVLEKLLQLADGRNIQLGTSVGTKIGTATSQKLGFYNATPIVQQSAITAPAGGATVDTQARTAINDLQTRLTNLGLTS